MCSHTYNTSGVEKHPRGNFGGPPNNFWLGRHLSCHLEKKWICARYSHATVVFDTIPESHGPDLKEPSRKCVRVPKSATFFPSSQYILQKFIYFVTSVHNIKTRFTRLKIEYNPF